ncbi:MAG: glycine zipper family protein [Aquificota bacterium]|nr:MAG: glycine zipper family protein [Aquificota bacterium]
MKKILTAGILTVSLIFSQAKALDGEIIFRDAIYGSGIGAVGGLALYAIDGKDFGRKIGTSVLIGLIFGVGVGLYESQVALVEIDNGKIHAGIPKIEFEGIKVSQNKEDIFSKVNLLGVSF